MREAAQRRLEAERDGEVLHSTSCDSITQVRSRPGMRTDSAGGTVQNESCIARHCEAFFIYRPAGIHAGKLPRPGPGCTQPGGLQWCPGACTAQDESGPWRTMTQGPIHWQLRLDGHKTQGMRQERQPGALKLDVLPCRLCGARAQPARAAPASRCGSGPWTPTTRVSCCAAPSAAALRTSTASTRCAPSMQPAKCHFQKAPCDSAR